MRSHCCTRAVGLRHGHHEDDLHHLRAALCMSKNAAAPSLFPIRHHAPCPKGPPCPSAQISSFLYADIMAPFRHMNAHTHNYLECYLEARRTVGFASRSPKSEIISVIHILLPDTNDLIMLIWSELTAVVWMGLMCNHSSISQDYVVDQECVWVCVCMRVCIGGPLCIFHLNTHIWRPYTLISLKSFFL